MSGHACYPCHPPPSSPAPSLPPLPPLPSVVVRVRPHTCMPSPVIIHLLILTLNLSLKYKEAKVLTDWDTSWMERLKEIQRSLKL